MLRASARSTAQSFDLRAITDRSADPQIDQGAELIAFATALVEGDATRLELARTELQDSAGKRAVVRAAAVAGNFQMMNRLVDATGVPIGTSLRAIATDLGLEPGI